MCVQRHTCTSGQAHDAVSARANKKKGLKLLTAGVLTLEHAFQQSHHHSQTCSANLLAHLCCTKLHQWLHKRTYAHFNPCAFLHCCYPVDGSVGYLFATRGCCIRDAMPTQICRTHRCVKHRQAPIHQNQKKHASGLSLKQL